MPSNPVEFKSPTKGVNKNLSWSDHTPDFAVDALNVLPFDLDGRNRIIQRPGTSKLLASAIGGGTGVMLLEQTTVPIDPAGQTPSTIAFNEPFTYSNGNLDTVATTAVWRCYRAGVFPGLDITETPGSWVVSSNAASIASNANPACAVYQGLPSLGNVYTLKASVRWTASSGTGTQPGIGFITRVNRATPYPTTAVITIAMNSDHLSIYQDTSTLLAKQTTPRTAGQTFALELRVTLSGGTQTYTVFVDGVQQLQATGIATVAGTNNGVGIYNSTDTSATVDNFQVLTLTPLATLRQNNLIAVSGGNVYVGDLTALPQATSGASVLIATARPQIAYSQGFAYLVDGTSLVKLNVGTKSVVTYTATAGSAPTGCTLACVYRDRLCLAAPYTTPQNFFFSRVGTHTDWDYSQTDPAAAFAGNASTAGHIGDPILALMPASDDILYLGGDHNLWAIRGDPADGGSIDMISDAIGVLGPNAWTKAPDGTVYFLGTGGLFRISGTGTPEMLSDGKWNDYFRRLDRAANYITLDWDRDHQGLYIFVTPVTTGTATHLFWDARGQGFWPIQFPNTWGPMSTLVFDGDGVNDRVTLLGTRDGYIMKMYDAAGSDDTFGGVTSYVLIGPYTGDTLSDQTMEWLDVVLGEPSSIHHDSDFNVVVQMQSGPTPEIAANAPLRTVSRTYSGVSRRQSRWRQRLRGNSFVLKLSNAVANRTWAFEKVVGMFLPSGTLRRYK